MSNFSDHCYSDYYLALGQRVAYAVYIYMTPVYVLVSLFGHVVSIRIFIEKWKNGEGAYMFQIFSTVSEGCFVLTHTGSIVMRRLLAGGFGISYPWFQSCYSCMFIAGHFCVATNNAIFTTMQLFSTCLAVDRFRALFRPMKYKSVSNRVLLSCAAFCLSVGFCTSVHQAFENKIIMNEATGFYTISGSSGDMVFAGLSYVRSVIRMLNLLVLYFCNVCIPYLYLKHLRASQNVLTSSAEQERRNDAKVLTMLAISECGLTTICVTLALAFDVWLRISPPCNPSRVTLFGASVDAALEVTTTIKFYLMMLLSKDFRKMFKKSVKCFRCGASSSVQPMVSSNVAATSAV